MEEKEKKETEKILTCFFEKISTFEKINSLEDL